MEVYIEYVILDNLIIDYLIVFFTQYLLSAKYKKINMFLAVSFGVVCAVVLPLFSIRNIYLISIKVLIGIVMTIILKKYANIREFLTTCIVLFTMTFVFGGLCLGVCNLLGLSISGGQVIINGYEFPMSIFVVFGSIYIYLFIQLIKYLKHKNKILNYYYDVEIKQNNNRYYLRGYLDSGNKLFDNNNPVVVISFKQFMKIFKDYPIEKIPLGSAPNNPHYIRTLSVGDKSKLLILDIDEITIKNNEKSGVYRNVKLGISKVNFSSDFDMLLHSSF